MEELIPSNWAASNNIIKVVGVGGGGGNAVTYMYKEGLKNVDFVICNTDKQALEQSNVPCKLQLGPILTKGLGCGTDSIVGQKAGQESMEEIRKMLKPTEDDNTEMCFITCGMGGGTGTGAAPVVAAAAKELGLLTVGVVTIPFRDEGPEALRRAVDGIKELKKHVDSLLIIDNQKLYEIYGDLDIFTAFPKADEVLATAVRSITEIICKGSYINADFADVKKVMQNSGMALMGSGIASGSGRGQKAVEIALKSPLLTEYDISTAKSALVNITCSSKSGEALSMSELSQIMDCIKQYTGGTTTFKRGVVREDEMGDAVSVTIIATGFEMSALPIIGDEIIHKGDIIEVKATDNIHIKHGLPLQGDVYMELTRRQRVCGTPALIVQGGEQIAAMEVETAYSRRDKMLNKTK